MAFWDVEVNKLAQISHLSVGSILSVESNQNVESKTKNVESKIAFLLQEISYFEP